MEATKISLVLCLLASLVSFDHVTATRLKGSVNFSEGNRNLVPLFLTRFGVKRGHEVYVFGTAERKKDKHLVGYHSLMTLAFIPQRTWDNFYSKATGLPSCQDVMNSTLSTSMIVSENTCVSGFDDYLRKVPCNPVDGDYSLCNQPGTVKVTPGSDFTFHKQNSTNTEFFYIFVVACTRNSTENCLWAESDGVYFNYDITVVNSDPTMPHKNYLEYQFSYEFNGVLILEMMFTIFYVILLIVQFALHSRLVAGKGYVPHRLINLFTASLALELFHVSFELMHFSIYAANGSGVVAMKYFGEIFNELSDWLLILVLILVAKGWQVTTCTIRWKKLTSVVWCVYIFISAVYFIWMVVKEQVYPLNTQLEHSFQSWVGGLYLIYRMIVMVYSLYGMRQMYLIENRPTKLRLYIVLSIIYVIWFVYLPVAVILSFAVNPVLRYMTLRAIILVFDLFINVFMLALFCPKWSDKFFQFKSHLNMLSRSRGIYESISDSYGSPPQVI